MSLVDINGKKIETQNEVQKKKEAAMNALIQSIHHMISNTAKKHKLSNIEISGILFSLNTEFVVNAILQQRTMMAQAQSNIKPSNKMKSDA